MERYAELTGHAPVLPRIRRRFSGNANSVTRRRTNCLRCQPANTNAAACRCPSSIIDYFNWTKMGDWKFDPTCWPESRCHGPRTLTKLGTQRSWCPSGLPLIPTAKISPNSNGAISSSVAHRARPEDSFIKFTDSSTNQTVISGLLDTTHPDARTVLWDKVRKNYFRHGIKIWWLDAIEPEMVALRSRQCPLSCR